MIRQLALWLDGLLSDALDAVGRHFEARERQRIDMYLAASTDLMDLERRLLRLECGGSAWLEGGLRAERRALRRIPRWRAHAPDWAHADRAGAPSQSFRALCEAVRRRQVVRALYAGQYRVLMPHAVGWSEGGEEVAVMYQLDAGLAAGGEPVRAAGAWKRMRIATLIILGVESGAWPSGGVPPPPESELLISEAVARGPGGSRRLSCRAHGGSGVPG